MQQPDLLPKPVIERRTVEIDLVDISDAFEYFPDPSDMLITSIQELGIVHPPLVTKAFRHGSRPMWRVLDGKRRIKAAKQLGFAFLRCTELIFPENDASYQVTLQMHGSRSDNKVGEAVAIRNLLFHGKSEAEISKLTGFSRATVRSRMVLHNINTDLWEALQNGRISVNTAISCAKLSPELQGQAYAILEREGKLTQVHLKGLRATRRQESMEQMDLPGMTNQILAGVKQSAYLSDHDLGLMLQMAETVIERWSPGDTNLYDSAVYLKQKINNMGVATYGSD
jgi:ParB-like chromosome segregation protein Spo0J